METHEKKMNLNRSEVQRHSTLFQDLRTHAREFHVRCHSSGLGVDRRPEHAPDRVRLFSIIRKEIYIKYRQFLDKITKEEEEERNLVLQQSFLGTYQLPDIYSASDVGTSLVKVTGSVNEVVSRHNCSDSWSLTRSYGNQVKNRYHS